MTCTTHHHACECREALIAKNNEQLFLACQKLGRIRTLLERAEDEGWQHVTIKSLRKTLGEPVASATAQGIDEEV